LDQHSSLQNIWLIITIWGIIYLSDYYLTLISAKKYRESMQEYIRYEGSFELTPQFQKDIDRLRLFSPQFLICWLLSIPLIYLVWWLSVSVLEQPSFFYFLIGALVLREVAIHLRHIRNLALYTHAKAGGVKGSIEYSRWLVLKLSAAELLSFCVVYLFFAIFFKSWFFLGGVFGCLAVAFQHWRLSKKASNSVVGNA